MGAREDSFDEGPQLALYQGVWRVFCGASVVFGVVAAALALPLEILELAALIALVAATTAAGLFGSAEHVDARWPRWRVVTVAAVASAGATVVLGLAVVLGASVLWLAVLLAVGSPPAVRWYRARLHLGARSRRPEVSTGSTAELCRQWRDSYEALRQATTDRQRLRIVLERQRCLDELGRRDPEGLEAWLATSASAAGDPARFLKSQ